MARSEIPEGNKSQIGGDNNRIRADIDNILQEGEGQQIEFKSWKKARNFRERVELAAEELVAFSNASGGTVYFGIEDNGEVSGCENYDVQKLIEAIYDKTRPPLFVEPLEIPYNEKTIIALHIEKDNDDHAMSDGRYLKRLGKNSKPWYPDSRGSKYDPQSSPDFSSKIIKASTTEDIDLLEVYNLKQKLKNRDPDSTLADSEDMAFLRDLNLLRDDDGTERLTIAGLLFVGTGKAIEKYLPQAEVIYLHYSSSNHEEYDARLDMKLPLLSIVDRMTERIQDADRIINVQIGLFRMEIHSYPMPVFQEALLNALSHRDYENMGAIYIKHYSDKIVIENPGGFPGGITKDNIITHPSVPRNKLIAETLQSLRYVQRSGQGVDIIFRDMISMGKPYPEYNVFSDSVSLTMRNSVEDLDFVKFIVSEQDEQGRTLSLSELMILRYLTENRHVAMKDIVSMTQTSMEESRKTVSDLIGSGLIELSGKQYMLTERVYSALKSDIEYTRDKAIRYIRAKDRILDYLDGHESITNAQIRELCGFTRQQARSTIDRMKEEGSIKMIGEGRGTKYVPTSK